MVDDVQNAEVSNEASATEDTALSAEAANTQSEAKTEETNEAQGSEETKLEKLYDNSDASEASDEAEVGAKAEEPEATAVDFEALEMPEGFELDQGALDKAKPIFAELGIDSQEGVQKLVSLFAEVQGDQAAQVASAIATQHEEWLAPVKAEWGSDYDERLGTAAKAMKAIGGDELAEALNITGAGNHSAVIKAFYKVGSLMSEDALVAGDSAVNKPNPMTSIYPSMKG